MAVGLRLTAYGLAVGLRLPELTKVKDTRVRSAQCGWGDIYESGHESKEER